MIKSSKIFEVYEERNRLYTKNLIPGKLSFNEKTVIQDKIEFREWDPTRSKLAAAILKGCKNTFIRPNNIILYLGISHGYTASHISDIIGKDGLIFGVDPAPRVMRDCVFVSQERKNIIPILANANHPEEYTDKIIQPDVIYQDISQKNQADIFLNNIDLFLKQGSYALLAIKARSIDITKKPKQIFNEIRKTFEKHLIVVDYRTLEPFQKDHAFIICKKK